MRERESTGTRICQGLYQAPYGCYLILTTTLQTKILPFSLSHPPILQKRNLRQRKRALLQTWDRESKVTAFSVPEADWAFLRCLSLFLRKFPIHEKEQVQKWCPCWRCLGKISTQHIEQRNISQAPYKIITYLRILFAAVTNSILLPSPLKKNFSPPVS